MSEAENIERVTNALRKVPEKHLLIIELNVPLKDGEIDYEKLRDIRPEVELAIAEAMAYGAFTLIAVDTLKNLIAGKSDVG